MKDSPNLSIYPSERLRNKLEEISDKEMRSVNQQILKILEDYIMNGENLKAGGLIQNE